MGIVFYNKHKVFFSHFICVQNEQCYDVKISCGLYLFSVFVSRLGFCVEGQILPYPSMQLSFTNFSIVPLICVGGQPGRICTEGFDDADAEVVCRVLAASLNLTSRGECAYWLF